MHFHMGPVNVPVMASIMIPILEITDQENEADHQQGPNQDETKFVRAFLGVFSFH
jgi:hypothetical protein